MAKKKVFRVDFKKKKEELAAKKGEAAKPGPEEIKSITPFIPAKKMVRDATKAFEAGNFEFAHKIFSELVKRKNPEAKWFSSLAVCVWHTKPKASKEARLAEMTEIVNRGLARFPTDPLLLVQKVNFFTLPRAIQLQGEGRLKESLALWRETRGLLKVNIGKRPTMDNLHALIMSYSGIIQCSSSRVEAEEAFKEGMDWVRKAKNLFPNEKEFLSRHERMLERLWDKHPGRNI